MNTTPTEIARNAARVALIAAHRNLKETITDCGMLSSDKSTQSAKNREYFAAQAEATKQAVIILQRFIDSVDAL